jgi:hypothetical protein
MARLTRAMRALASRIAADPPGTSQIDAHRVAILARESFL